MVLLVRDCGVRSVVARRVLERADLVGTATKSMKSLVDWHGHAVDSVAKFRWDFLEEWTVPVRGFSAPSWKPSGAARSSCQHGNQLAFRDVS